jgi:hypothetical protein
MSQYVHIKSDTGGASIYYTTDGSTPTNGGAGSTLFQADFSVGATTTVKAVAFKSGMTDSDMATVTITMDFGPLVSVAITPSTIDVSLGQQVSVTLNATAGTLVKYVFVGADVNQIFGGEFVQVDTLTSFPKTTAVYTNPLLPSGTWWLDQIEIDTPTLQYKYYFDIGNQVYGIETRLPGQILFSGTGRAPTTIQPPTFTVSNGATSSPQNIYPPLISNVRLTSTGTGAGGAYVAGDTVSIEVDASDSPGGPGVGYVTTMITSSDQWLQTTSLPGWMVTNELDFTVPTQGTYQILPIPLGGDLVPNPYPFDLVANVRVANVFGNAATSTVTIPYAYTWPPTTVNATPQAPSDTWNSFTLSPSQYDIRSYSLTISQRYYFQTNDGMGGGGTNTATNMTYYLIWDDKTPQAFGPVTGQNWNNHLNAPSFISSKTGTLYVISRMGSAGNAGGTAAHRLTTTAPTTP